MNDAFGWIIMSPILFALLWLKQPVLWALAAVASYWPLRTRASWIALAVSAVLISLWTVVGPFGEGPDTIFFFFLMVLPALAIFAAAVGVFRLVWRTLKSVRQQRVAQ